MSIAQHTTIADEADSPVYSLRPVEGERTNVRDQKGKGGSTVN
jgi:hypothetical protein